MEGMTDKQYKAHLQALLVIARGCADLPEFIAILEKEIKEYDV